MSEPNDVINCRCLGYSHFLEVGLEELKNHGLSVHEGSVARTLAEMQARQLAELERVVLDQFIRDTSLEETMPALTDRSPMFDYKTERRRSFPEQEHFVERHFFDAVCSLLYTAHPFGPGGRPRVRIEMTEVTHGRRSRLEGRVMVQTPQGPMPPIYLMHELGEVDLTDPLRLERIAREMARMYCDDARNGRSNKAPLTCTACGSTACSKCEGDGCKARQKAKREQEAVKAQMARKAEEQKRIDRHNGMVAAMTNIGLAIDYAYQNLDNTLRLQERWTHSDRHSFVVYPHSSYKELLAAYKSRLVREELKRREQERAVKVQAELDPWD